jgi:hypothetical protein
MVRLPAGAEQPERRDGRQNVGNQFRIGEGEKYQDEHAPDPQQSSRIELPAW